MILKNIMQRLKRREVQEMATVFDVARYVLDSVGTTTTMKLQKLCYYCQAWSLAWDDAPLFNEDFQAWANGPVCKELFQLHKGKYAISSNDLQNNHCEFSDSEKETMDAVIKYYSGMTPLELSGLTHMERPWKAAREGIDDGEPCTNIITKDSMQEYYGGLV